MLEESITPMHIVRSNISLYSLQRNSHCLYSAGGEGSEEQANVCTVTHRSTKRLAV